jgi:hypothetical protein
MTKLPRTNSLGHSASTGGNLRHATRHATPPNAEDASTKNPENGLRPIGQIAAKVIESLHFRMQINLLHNLGPRVLGEFLAEIGARTSQPELVQNMIDRYLLLLPECLSATGGDRWPPVPSPRAVPDKEPEAVAGGGDEW